MGPTNNWYPGRYTEDMPEDPAEVFGFANIVGPDGIGGSPKQYPNMMQGWVVSSTCENPEAAIRLMDYLYTAGRRRTDLPGRGRPDVRVG